MRIVVGQHCLGIGNFDVGMFDPDGRGNENEVYLLAFKWRNAAEVVESVGRTGVIRGHVVSIQEFAF